MIFSTSIKAASLAALIFYFAIGASAADSDSIFSAGFTPQASFGGSVRLRLQNNAIDPLLVVAEDTSDRKFPVRFNFEHKNIDLQPQPIPFLISSLKLYYESDSQNQLVARTRVFSDNTEIDGIWGDPSLLTTGMLLDVIDSLSSYRVGAPDTHTVAFTTTTTSLDDSGTVWIIFPAGFNIESVGAAVYSDDDPTNDGTEPIISEISREGQALLLHLDNDGQQALPGSRIWLRFWPVVNDTVSGSYSVLVMSTGAGGEIRNGPVESQTFVLTTDTLDHVILLPDSSITLMAGAFLDLTASGYDRYGNPISSLSFSYDITVDSCGQIVDSGLRGARLGACYATASAGGLVDSTGLITIVPGSLDRFSISNYPSARTAGVPFSDTVFVVAYDSENNKKYDYFGQVWFSTGDTIDVLPHRIQNPYTFTVADSGMARFPGPSFILKRAGVNRTILATNDTVGQLSSPIRVTPAAISTFSMSAGATQTAGQAFYVNVNNASDSYGNLSAGDIIVSDSIGGRNSPDSIPPSYNPIVVNGGTGQSLQTLTNAVPTMLKGVLSGGGARANTAMIQVLPGTLGRFNLARYPDIIVAGDIFPQPVTVTAYDLFGNLKTNYTGSVYFTSTDPRAILPYTPGSPYQFTVLDQGVHSFNESFSLLTAGRQNISVTDGIIEMVSNAINVSPDLMTSFNASAPDSVVAGQAFPVIVSNARDQWGNAADGVIAVSDSVGGGESPGGIPPTYNQIVVSGGSGQAMQTLTRTIPTILKCVLVDGNLRQATGIIQVKPGALARFEAAGYPDEVFAGDVFPIGITVSAFDALGNTKTDFDDFVYFESTDSLADLPYTQTSPFHFLAQYQGTHDFTEPFILYTAGLQRITITDGGISEPSDFISVLPDNIDAFTLTAPDTAVSGLPFTLMATNVLDQWGNPANGIIAVSDSIGGGPSPGGDQPTLNEIVVSNGSGQAQQLLTNAVPTRLKGVFAGGNIIAVTDSIIVMPGALALIAMTGIPSSTVAGDTFPGNVGITVFDPFENVKTDFVESVYFESTDPRAILPYTQGAPYHFTALDQGSHDFAGPFVLLTAGWRRVSVTNGDIETISEAINVLPDIISSFSLSAPDTVVAGLSYPVDVSNAIDQWGNSSNGIIAISDSVGGGPAPDGSQPSYNQIVVNNGSGLALQISTHAVPTRLKGVLIGGNVRAATNLFQVQPGSLGRFEASGYPGSTVAGNIFPQSISVSVFDLYGNIKTNFDDFVYFASTDPQALLPYTQSSPFHFLAQYQGMHVFGEQFSLRSSGSRLIAFGNGVREVSSPPIQVSPNIISEFALIAPDGAVAGQPFSADVSNARDIWNNFANGIVVIADSIGGGPSPNGTTPIFSSIQVVSGSGSASQTLFNVVPTVLKGAAGSIIRTTGQIDVTPAQLGSFNFELSSPQFEGNPFTGIARLAAFDRYGNLKTDNNAAADTVVISSSAGGSMDNNILRSPTDFINGLADLTAIGATFYGRGGTMSFRATSQSGVIANSATIEMEAMMVQSLNIDQDMVRHGDTITGNVSVANLGGIYLELTALDIIDSIGTVFNYTVNPTLPYIIGAGQTRGFDFSFDLPTSVPLGIHPITAGARGIYSTVILDTVMVSDTIPGFPDRFSVTAGSVPVYVAGTLYPETLSTALTYAFSMRLGNTGVSGVALYDTSYFTFTDGVHTIRAELSSSIYLPPDSPSGVIAVLDSIVVDQAFVPGSYLGAFHFYGIENGLFRTGEIQITDPVMIESRASITYLAGSLNIDSLVTGQRVSFAIRVNNSGSADFIVNHQNTQLSFGDGLREYIAHSDTSAGNRIDIISQGDTTFNFAHVMVPSDFTTGNYRPNVVLSGYQNGHPEVVSFITADTVKVLTPAAVRLNSTFALSHNAPMVNTAQACSIIVVIENMGDEAAESLFVHLDHADLSSFPDSIHVPRIAGHEILPIMFHGNAAPDSTEGEVFTSSVVGGRGAISHDPAGIIQPLDNTALLVVEIPATLAISPITVVDPPEAMDDTISTGQTVTISATVSNLGQAGISDSRRLFLNPGLTGWEVDSLDRDFQLGQPVTWSLTAPSDPYDSAPLIVSFANQIYDLNDNTSAFGPDTLSTIDFVIDTRPFITHSAAITEPQGAVDRELSTNQIFVVTDTLFTNGIYSSKGVRLHLPDGFTTDDSLVKFPEGNVASWHLRAPAAAANATIILSSWIYDINTGDSIGTLPRFIDVVIVPAASLAISSRIAGPPTAIDGILQPGSQVQFEAVVQNSGVAAVSDGQMRLRLGRSDMIPTENPIRSFVVGVPIFWTISIPSIEVNFPVPISAVLSDTPTEDNTGQAASVTVDSTAVPVMIRELYPKLVLTDISGHQGSVFKGQNLQILTFELLNNDFGGNFPIAVTGFVFDIATNPAMGASELIANALVTSDSSASEFGGFDQNRFSIDLTDTVYIAPAGRVRFSLAIDIEEGTPVRDFSIHVGNDFVSAHVIENGIVAQDLLPVSPSGEPVSWQTDPTAVVEQSFAASISSYPNPFNPREGGTKIGYFLPSAAGLEIRIFTLLGDLVWTRTVAASDPLGTAGLHTGETALVWEGKNDIGAEIRSGVYICMIKNLRTGEEEKFKIAVVK
ncbi:MAG: hypothetical protein A2W25_02670 [candidate division Zixibacteria bacterium RBG_16_53_22]|nr:MAG: hypothetical protein A2W25_02670 [candidate division Zixibacteria bacterium RBG_16_53_22]